MRRSWRWTFLLVLAGVLALGVGACGGGKKKSETSTNKATPVKGKQGGKVTMLWANDTDFIDPGATYYQAGFMIVGATQDMLYWYRPDNSQDAVPLLAEAAPQISPDGKTVTVKIRQGVKFSPPVNRVVTSKDVKYAVERGFFKTVNNGYAGAYFGNLIGAKTGVNPGTTIPGIETPDDQTIVFKLSKPTGGVLAGALALPISAPVPKEYAAKYDKQNPSAYGNYQVATGPYMIKNNSSGKAVGYSAGKDIHLVRNPNWNKSLDFRPAYLDEIDMPEGNSDATVAARKILTGPSMLNGDFAPPPPLLKQAYQKQRSQLALVPSGGGRWIGLNNKLPPFNNINIRKAVSAGMDRNALRLTRGGPLVGDIPTHFIPPGIPGFDEAGGMKGPGVDYLAGANGDPGAPNPQLMAEYFKKAGMSSGKYEGKDTLLMVGDADGVAAKTAEVAKTQFEQMGFKVRLRLVTHDSMYTKFCNVPAQKVQICPNVGWFKDFQDPQTLLDPTFNGKNILPENNSNWAQLDVPAINDAMTKAEALTDKSQRAQAWAAIDKQITEQAPVVPWIWDKQPLIASPNINGVASTYLAEWDLPWISLK